MNELVEKLERLFSLHIKYEYPQVDVVTAKYLAFELACIAASECDDEIR